MVVCICKGINDERILQVIDLVSKPSDVHTLCGSRVQCGKCLQHIKTILEEHNNANDTSQQPEERQDGSS